MMFTEPILGRGVGASKEELPCNVDALLFPPLSELTEETFRIIRLPGRH